VSARLGDGSRSRGSVGKPAFPVAPREAWTPEFDPADYRRKVAEIIGGIERGDYYQVNLTERFTSRFDDAPGVYEVWMDQAHAGQAVVTSGVETLVLTQLGSGAADRGALWDVHGGEAAESITGTDVDDILRGAGGNDVLVGDAFTHFVGSALPLPFSTGSRIHPWLYALTLSGLTRRALPNRSNGVDLHALVNDGPGRRYAPLLDRQPVRVIHQQEPAMLQLP